MAIATFNPKSRRSEVCDEPGSPRNCQKIVDELERENARLQRLVAELLARNQQLRQALESATRVGSVVADVR